MKRTRHLLALGLVMILAAPAIAQEAEPPEAPVLVGIDLTADQRSKFRKAILDCAATDDEIHCASKVIAEWPQARRRIPLKTADGITWLPDDLYAPFLAEMRACQGIQDETSQLGCFQSVVHNYAALSRGRSHD